MAAPSAPVDICQIAIDYLSQRDSIASIETPKSDAEIVLARHYDKERRALIREFDWNFAKKRAKIARTGTPVFEYTDAYLLPSDFLKFRSISNPDINFRAQRRDYEIENGEILINASGSATLNLRYLFDETEVTKWDSLFTKLFPMVLAEAIAYKFSLKKGVLEMVNGLIAQTLPKAFSVDGQERPPRRIQRSRYIGARKNGLYSASVASPYTIFDE